MLKLLMKGHTLSPIFNHFKLLLSYIMWQGVIQVTWAPCNGFEFHVSSTFLTVVMFYGQPG